LGEGEEREKNISWYADRGIVFVTDEWSLWHIRVWANSRVSNGFGVSVDPQVVFEYARKWDMDTIQTLEMARRIERSVADGTKKS
jgi:hypothetical protein